MYSIGANTSDRKAAAVVILVKKIGSINESILCSIAVSLSPVIRSFLKNFVKKCTLSELAIVIRMIGIDVFIMEKIKIKNTSIKVSDVSLFQKLIESLTIPERWKMRLKRHFWRPQYFEDLLKRLETNSDADTAVVELDKKRFTEMKNLDQSKEIASRKVFEILSRFDRKIKDPRAFAENKKIVKIIREFLKINCPINQLDKTLKNFVKKNKLSNSVFKDLSTIKNLSKINSKTIFSTNFGRDIEYYTGIVFEIYNSSKKEIARGGRYDGLLKSLGSKKNISAVGAAINLNNLQT